ncbi:hypothetical protein N7493_000425 [Penicillium malachiteum]|uniref:Uncharacterized protein n=1 Tax=Penicillium malachiteum TaxID=1324776 RepID=A0AAD6HWX4_9EURO|nr:hypothetical protein N7493_000425 [Penicillium malachiteum]
MDANGGYEVHRGVIPREYRPNFYSSVAKYHVCLPQNVQVEILLVWAELVQLTSLRLPKIGTIIQNHEGEYESGPIPGIGGPFDTATKFLRHGLTLSSLGGIEKGSHNQCRGRQYRQKR